MSTHTIRIPIIVLTPRSKKLFLNWALEGFKLPRLAKARVTKPAKVA
jgi:hypothetical protein